MNKGARSSGAIFRLQYLVYFLIGTLIVTAIAICLFVNLAPTFGGTPDAQSLAKITQSKHYRDGRFVNLSPIHVATPDKESDSLLSATMSILNAPADKNPSQPLPSKSLHANTLTNNSFIWLGHSTVLFKTAGKTLITDPVFHAAAPVSFAVRPFPIREKITVDDLPPLDAVIISHDHYDHLDYKAIEQLDHKVKHFYVPLGIKAHLQRWGVADEKITEMDWYESANLGDIELTLTPARHFSGRGLFNRFSTLWGSWVIQSPTLSVYFSGDGGYSPEFATIGEKYGPFDIAFMEDGAYNKSWAEVHMQPEQAVKAAAQLKARTILPIHWAKFDLALHPWAEPAQRISAAVDEHNAALRDGATPLQLATPVIGQTFTLESPPSEHWWDALLSQAGVK